MSSELFSNPNGKKNVSQIITKILKYFGIFIIIASVAGVGIVSGTMFALIDTAGQLSPEQLKLTNSVTVLYDINQNPVESIYGSENREWADINKIPSHLQQAFIAIEDERFYSHNGIDLRRIGGAVLSALKPGGRVYGASTITQQLVKQLTREDDFSLKRKIQEQWRAIQLEKKLTKQQILELYLNVVPLGNNLNGVQSAAKVYFNKDVDELTLAECASIAGITQYPVKYDPFTNKANNKKRQENILFKMKELGYITDEKVYQDAIKEELKFTNSNKANLVRISNHSYFADQVINDVVRDLQNEKGYSKAIAEKMVYGGGLKIYTTMDSNVQKAMDKVYTNPKSFVQTSSKVQPESAMVIIDPKNGQIRGLIGGIGEKKANRILNRATQSYRQPGSSIKPIAIYAPAIERGKISPSTIIDDAPIKIGNWEPHNYDNKYRGPITVKEAITHSINTVAVRILQKVGIDNSYDFISRLGISTLEVTDRDYAPLALGGLSKGVSPLELAAAYVPFANKGVYIKPYTYLKVEDSEGHVLLENTVSESRQVMTENTAYIMTDLLQNVVTSGTATSARLSKIPAAGKTGTASDVKDKWFVGFTPYYVGAVWYGYDQPQELPASTWNSALSTWKSVMEQVHANLPFKDFTPPKDFTVQVAICSSSGQKASEQCYKDLEGSKVKIMTLAKGSQPSSYCSIHVPVKICNESNKVATSKCPISQTTIKSTTKTVLSTLQKCDIHPSTSPIEDIEAEKVPMDDIENEISNIIEDLENQ